MAGKVFGTTWMQMSLFVAKADAGMVETYLFRVTFCLLTV